MFTAIILASG